MGPAWHLMTSVDHLAALLITCRMPCNGAKTVTQSLCVTPQEAIREYTARAKTQHPGLGLKAEIPVFI